MLSGIANVFRSPGFIRGSTAVFTGVVTYYTVRAIDSVGNGFKHRSRRSRALARKRLEAKKLAKATPAAKPVLSEAVQAVMDNKSVKELRVAAKAQGVSGYSKMVKVDLAEALVAGAVQAAATTAA